MKKTIVISALALMVVVLSSAIERVQKSAGPPSCHANEPPGNLNCTDCHTDATLNTGSAAITFDLGGAEDGYIPGQTYNITVSVSRPSLVRAGFQCIALQDNDNRISPGTVTLNDENRTQVLDKNAPHSGGCLEEERVWIEHTFNGNTCDASGKNQWTYRWKAPDVNVGSVSFYLSALEANNDLAETGDNVYTRKKTITGLTGIAETDRVSYTIYPMPANGMLLVQPLREVPQTVVLYGITGTAVRTWKQQELQLKDQSIKLDLGGLEAGVYFLHIKSGDASATQKVLVR
jgi:hypothetical protein